MTLPWSEVNARPGFEIAALLEPHGLVQARERYKWACPTPSCTSSDGFHTFPQAGRRSRCFVCQTKLTNVDLAALVRGEDPRDACRWLAGQLGIFVEAWQPGTRVVRGSTGPRTATPGRVVRAPTPLEALLASPNPVMPHTLYADILDRTTLSAKGAAYLRSRGIPADFARNLGFRSVDGPSAWAALRKHLAATYPTETLRAAGFAKDDRGAVWTPFGGLLPMLLIPYRRGDLTLFIRMRTIGPPPGRLAELIPDWGGKAKRYRAPRDVVPTMPFNADALTRPVVHLVEGELNAATLMLPRYDLHAIGLPGAGVLEPEWILLLASTEVLVTWYDDDDAGLIGRTRVRELVTTAHGAEWAASRLYHVRLPRGRDANQLHLDRKLAPLVAAAPWMRLAARTCPA